MKAKLCILSIYRDSTRVANNGKFIWTGTDEGLAGYMAGMNQASPDGIKYDVEITELDRFE